VKKSGTIRTTNKIRRESFSILKKELRVIVKKSLLKDDGEITTQDHVHP